MKHYALIALMLATSAFADKRIDEVKNSAKSQGIELTFEMSPEGFKYAKGLIKPLGGKARVKKDKSFLKAEDRVPASFDIRSLLANTSYTEGCGVYDQGNCGSCVYNSIARNFCDSLRLRNVPNIPKFLSRQELMSCTQGGRCNGEWAMNVGKYLKQLGGLHDEAAFPYKASSSSSCPQVQGVRYGQIQDTKVIDNSPKSMFTALNKGYPISITVGADNAWMSYKSGVYNYCSTNAQTNHEILLYGYRCIGTAVETIDGKQYCKFDEKGNAPAGQVEILVPNSWGMWGEQGYMWTKLTNSNGRLCNNVTEEAVILETGIPMPTPKPPVPPTPVPVPFTFPKWLLFALIGLGGLLAGIFGSRLFKK